ncbi:MAG: COX15/CtaA family protein [Haloarculaceae archaeon]
MTTAHADSWPRAFRWLITLSFVGTLVLMGAATYSVALQGWMSCGGDFPKCAGYWAPVLHSSSTLPGPYSPAQIIAEWFHRATAFVTGVLMLVATGVAWRRLEGYQLSRSALTVATALLPVEAWLGVLTGVPDPAFASVALHTVISLAVVALLGLVTAVVWWPIVTDRGGGESAGHSA